jgi:site-specific DNA-cytosine methylase
MYVMELFPCSGGMAEGLRRAGIEVSVAFDKDPNACASYEANLRHAPVRMDVNDLHRMVSGGWRPERRIDLLVADPPCTPWSRAGKRKGRSDERDMLDVTVDLVRMLRPRAYLIANVPGLDDAPNWPVVQQTIGSLAAAGYCANDFARLDAADYGVPQHRVRPFWYGHLAGPCVSWPIRTHGSPAESSIPSLFPGLLPYMTCRQALGHLKGKDLGAPVRLRWRGQNGAQAGSVPDRPARVVAASSLSDGNILTTPEEASRKAPRVRPAGKKARASVPDEPAHVVTANEQGDGNFLDLTGGPNHRVSRLDAPARTVTANTHSDGALLEAPEVAASSDMFSPSYADEPSKAIRAAARGSQVLTSNPKHPPNTLDAPSSTVAAKADRGGQGAQELIIDEKNARYGRPSRADEPSRVVLAGSGTNGNKLLEWPWDRPSTTVTTRHAIAPPGHHPEEGSVLSLPNAVKLSEKAAAILQGFPDGWVFAGKTKESRWSQIGQAMPPGLAHAVGSRILVALRAMLQEAS